MKQIAFGDRQMITAYVLAKVDAGKDAEVLKGTREISGVKQK